MRILLAFFLLFASLVNAKEIALTFDDAPRPGTEYYTGVERSNRLIEELRKAGVPRVGFFANSSKMDREGRKRLNFYGRNGHLIGNHTHSHFDINRVSVKTFIEDIHTAHHYLRGVVGFQPYFRFPYLREGSDLGRRDEVRKELKRMGYRNAYITVDNYDWEIDRQFQNALREKKKVDLIKLREVYLEIMLDALKYYDEMAMDENVLGRSPRHVLLLHENDLNALFIGDLITAMKQRGWTIISPDRAYTDPIAKIETQSLWKSNAGRIAEIARDKGFTGEYWHESCDEEYIYKALEQKKVFQ